MDRWNEHTMEMERESMDRQGEAMEIRLSRLGLAGAILSEHEIERLQAKVARLREALEGLKHCDGCYCEAAFSMPDGSHPRHSVECEAACDALDSSSGHWLRQHDAEVRAQERERCAGLLDEKELERRNAATRAEAMKEERCIVLTLEVEADEFAELAAAIREADDDV